MQARCYHGTWELKGTRVTDEVDDSHSVFGVGEDRRVVGAQPLGELLQIGFGVGGPQQVLDPGGVGRAAVPRACR